MSGWGDRKRSLTDPIKIFNTIYRYKDHFISEFTSVRTTARFHDTGSVIKRLKSGRPKTATDDENACKFCNLLLETLTYSCHYLNSMIYQLDH